MTTRLRTTSALALGSAASGALAYVFFILVTRTLGPVDAAPVAVLWAYWSFAGAALTFPLQHWIARTVEAHGGEQAVRVALPGVLRLVVAVAAATTTVSWLARDQLFGSRGPWLPFLVGAITLGSTLMGVSRGVLTARRRYAAVGAGLVAENGLRCLAALALVLAGAGQAEVYGLALLVGYAAAAAWPSAFALARSGARDRGRSAAVFLGGAGGGQLIAQGVLTGGPVVLAVVGGASAQVTALFAGLALFRAPYTLALGVVAQLTAAFTRLVVDRRSDRLRRIRSRLVAATLGGSLLAAVVGWVAGPALLRLLFGPGVSLPSTLCLLLAVGSTVAMANLVVTLMVLAHSRTPGLVRAWLLALVPGVAWFALAGGSALERTCGAFLVVEVAALGFLLVEEVRGTARLGR